MPRRSSGCATGCGSSTSPAAAWWTSRRCWRAWKSGKVAGAALDFFAGEPPQPGPLLSHERVVVTPHLGASTAEATDRAGYQVAEQVVAALCGGVVTTAVNIPAVRPEEMEVLGPLLPLARQLGRLAMALAKGSAIERVEAGYLGRIAELDTRLLTLAAICGVLEGRTEQPVNLVNAPAIAEERGIVVEAKAVSEAQDFHELIRVTVRAGGENVAVAGTAIGPQRVPHLVEVYGQRFTVALEPYVTVFRYADLPGMIGRVGSVFGAHGVNISSAAVGRSPDGSQGEGRGRLAAMVVTTDSPVPEEVVAEIVASDGFEDGCTAVLS